MRDSAFARFTNGRSIPTQLGILSVFNGLVVAAGVGVVTGVWQRAALAFVLVTVMTAAIFGFYASRGR